MLVLEVFYVALFLALIFFGPLQAYVEKKKPELDRFISDPEKTGLMLCIVLIVLASTYFMGKIR